MLKSELLQVIESLETEKANIEYFIQEHLEEEDYLMAHYYSQALQEINQTLRKLYNFNDPLYDKRKVLESRIRFYEKVTREKQSAAGYWDEKREELSHQLFELNQQKPKQVVEGQGLDDAIFDLVDGKTKSFKLHLKKKANFWIEFKRSEKPIISISLTPSEKITEYGFLESYQVNKLITLGFILNEDTRSMEYSYDATGFRTALPLKIVIARIIFEIFYYQHGEFDHPASLECD